MNYNKLDSIKEDNTYIFKSHNSNETKNLGKKLGKLLRKGDLIALDGDLGAGKTCLVQGIALGLNSKDDVTSPSFSLIKEYSGDIPIYHFDLYRLENNERIEDLGYEEYFFGNGITLIEWAEKIQKYLPEQMLKIMIKMNNKNNHVRTILIEATGKRYKEIIGEINIRK